MTAFINSIVKISTSFHLMTTCRNFYISPVFQLYSQSAIGIDNYLNSRKRIKEQFTNFTDKFRTKMTVFIADPKNMIFTEDLKNMIHLAEPSDVNLVISMIKKFNSQNSEFRFGSFVFGPVVMRMFYFLDAPKEALQCFEDPTNNGFFDQLISYQILLDLLYTHEMYEEMYSVFEKVKEKQINMTKYPKYPVVLILAACYKQNTPQSFKYASRLWTDMTTVGTRPLRRASTFMAGLALKQGAPHVALESISMQRQQYVTIRNIKASALADMGRPDDALPVLRSVLDIDIPEQKDKHTFFEETVAKVRAAVEKSNNKDLQKEFENVEKALKDRGLIDYDQSLDKLLNCEITMSLPKTQDQPRGMPSTLHRKMPFGPRRNNNFMN